MDVVGQVKYNKVISIFQDYLMGMMELSRMSCDELPTNNSNLPGSKIQSCIFIS